MIKNLEKLMKLTEDTFLLNENDDVSTTFKIKFIIENLDYCKEIAEEDDFAMAGMVDGLIHNICKMLDTMNDEEFDELIKELSKDLVKYYQDIDTLGQWYEIIQEERR